MMRFPVWDPPRKADKKLSRNVYVDCQQVVLTDSPRVENLLAQDREQHLCQNLKVSNEGSGREAFLRYGKDH